MLTGEIRNQIWNSFLQADMQRIVQVLIEVRGRAMV
jgi:hypothetical protein